MASVCSKAVPKGVVTLMNRRSASSWGNSTKGTKGRMKPMISAKPAKAAAKVRARWRSTHSSERRYLASKLRMNGLGASLPPERIVAMCAGRIRKDSTSENASTMTTTAGICQTILPAMPPKAIRGANASMVVRAAAVTAGAISAAPARAASAGAKPPACLTAMRSATTTASSTTMPNTMTNPVKATRLRVMPSGLSSMRPPVNTMGMPTSIQSAALGRTNRNNTPATSRAPMNPLVAMRLRRLSISTDSSLDRVSSTAGSRFMSAMAWRT